MEFKLKDRMVTTIAPSRLHFGLINCGNLPPNRRSPHPTSCDDGRMIFGGVGAMIERPGVRVSVSTSSQFEVSGKLRERTRRFARISFDHFSPQLPFETLESLTCRIHVEAPDDHVGLGTGTQLALSIHRTLCQYFDLTEAPIENSAATLMRGNRSAVGIHGFDRGGIIFDQGKPTAALQDCQAPSIGKLKCQFDPDVNWRVLVGRERGVVGLYGEQEIAAFRNRIEFDCNREEVLVELINQEMIPALSAKDFGRFAEAVGQFGEESGLYYRKIQGGPYYSDKASRLVDSLQKRGFPGAGQSSWGPTLYVLSEDSSAAREARAWLERDWPEFEWALTRFNSGGAKTTLDPNREIEGQADLPISTVR